MRQRITRIAPVQLGKVAAVMYAFVSIPLVVIMGASFSISPGAEKMPIWLVLVVPIFYIVFGFVFTVIGAWLYNVAAKWTGGIEYVSEEAPPA